VRKLFTISGAVKARLERWGGIKAEVMYPPPPQRAYHCETYGDYIFAVSRLAPLKRFSLLIEALTHPDASGIRCVIAGEGEEYPVLEHAIVTRGLQSRVKLIGRIDDRQLLEHLARCRAVCFPPYDEDYGFVTAEAFSSRKPVITCTDSGGPAELVKDRINGWVVPPRPDTLAAALREAVEDLPLAERLGNAGFKHASYMTWESAVRHLLAP
jgi:glycosyltransferase involved in cell wall biosynthesis